MNPESLKLRKLFNFLTNVFEDLEKQKERTRA